MGVVCNDRCSDIIIIYLPELFAFSASRFRQTIQAGILYCYNTVIMLRIRKMGQTYKTLLLASYKGKLGVVVH